MKNKFIYSIILFVICLSNLVGQKGNIIDVSNLPYYNFGKGVGITSPDSLFQFNIRFRIQSRFSYFKNQDDEAAFDGQVRRLRLRFDGFVGDPRFLYVIQLSFAPGDVGEIDEEGFMKITDRKKDIMITAGGKNIAPQFIENLLKFSPYINDAVIIADKRKYVTAIIVIDEENVVKYAQDLKVQYTTFASLTRTQEVNELIQSEINKVNKELARVEAIKKFRILDKKLYTEDGEVTPTMKVKRKYINEHYKDLIESMYKD